MIARLRALLQGLLASLTRRALATGVRGASARGAAQLGLSAAAFAFLVGLALGGLPAGGVGFALGRASSALRAEINALRRDLAEARIDTAAARAAETAARAAETRNAAARATAESRNDAYAKELRRLGPMGACGLNDRDLARMRDNAWSIEPRARRPASAARR